MKQHVVFFSAWIVLTLSIGGCSTPATPTSTSVPTAASVIPTTLAAAPSATTVAVTPTKALPTLSPTPAAKDLLLAALNGSLPKLKTYRARVPQEGRLVEVVLPDRFHQIENEEIVKIGPTLMQPGVLRMNVQNVPAYPPFDRLNPIWFRDQIQTAPRGTVLGPTTVDGAPTIGYSVDLPYTKITPSKTPGATPEIVTLYLTAKIWVATIDGFPRRIEYGAPIAVSVTLFDFNAQIEVSPLQ